MKRVLIIAPIDSSSFAACLLLRIAAIPGIEIAGVLIRSVTLDRALKEWRRDGPRLLLKIWTNHLLRGRGKSGNFTYPNARQQMDQMGYKREGLGAICRRHGWPTLSTPDLNSAQAVEFARGLCPSIAIFAGGGMVRAPLIEACGEGVLNCHMGPLPRYRGMDVVEWPFLEESAKARTAVTVHFMDQGLDTGPIVETADIPRTGCRSIADLRTAAEGLKIAVLLRAIEAHRDGTLRAQAQLPDAGRQYYVLHPVLSRIAAARCRRALSI